MKNRPHIAGIPLASALLSLLAQIALGAEESKSPAALNPTEQFKTFISSPPVIRNLVFQQKVPMDGGARPLDGTFALSTRFEYFQARWQRDGILFRRLSSPADAANFTVFGQLVSVSDHGHTLLEPSGRLTTWDDRDRSTIGKTSSIFYTSQFLLDPLRRILNLGIMYAGIGTVKWSGNSFRAECDVDQEHVTISGQLLADADAPPLGLRLRYTFPHQTYDYHIRYEYASGAAHPFLPKAVTSLWLPPDRKGAEIEVDQWRILNFEIAESPLAAESFDALPFLQSNRWAGYIYTNGAFYERATNGALRFAYKMEPPATLPPQRPRIPPTLFYTGWGGLNVALFALMLGARENRSKQPKCERSHSHGL